MDRKKLCNPIYGSLPAEERNALLLSLPKLDGRFTFERFERFAKFGIETETAVYSCEGREFVFVPGTVAVMLGWDDFENGIDDEMKKEITEELEAYDYQEGVEVFLRESMSPVRTAAVAPMLAERGLNEIGWRDVALDSEEMRPFEEYIRKGYVGEVHMGEVARFFRNETGEICARICDEIPLDDFLEEIHDENFSLPTEDEWEYLCGGGNRTLFRWGDGIDYNMKLPCYRDYKDPLLKAAPFDLEEPNQFGLSIAYDPYKYEVVENSEYFVKGGDGGCNVCGGGGVFYGLLPLATAFRSLSKSNDGLGYQENISGSFTFYRRIVRLDGLDKRRK